MGFRKRDPTSLVKIIDGAEQSVFHYEPGGYFGELALINNEPRKASVVAGTDMKLMVIDKEGFERI